MSAYSFRGFVTQRRQPSPVPEPSTPRQILLPDRLYVGQQPVGGGEDEAGSDRFSVEVHAGLFRCPVSLLGIAAATASDHVLPTGAATTAARKHVVERQVVGVNAAVLAGVVVTAEQVLAVERYPLAVRAANVAPEADNAGDGEDTGWRPKDLVAVLYPFGGLMHEQ